MKFLIDENLSPKIAIELGKKEHDAVHIRDKEMLGFEDEDVMNCALQEQRILVTSNIRDFYRIAAQLTESHPVIVFFQEKSMPRSVQIASMFVAVQALESGLRDGNNLENQVLRIYQNGDTMFENVRRLI